MMSLEDIKAASNEAAERAAIEHMTPYVPFDENDVERMPPFPFPMLGDYVPYGWKLVDTLFVDSSGFGQEGEPAMTAEQLKRHVLSNLSEGYGYAITEAGQFQVYIGVYKQTRRKAG